jgi:hypothetical protein
LIPAQDFLKRNGGGGVMENSVMNLADFIQRALGRPPKIHPVDRGLAKHWTKQRLIAVFPELRNDARRLEAAYRALDLAPRPSATDPSETIFEIGVHRDIEP